MSEVSRPSYIGMVQIHLHQVPDILEGLKILEDMYTLGEIDLDGNRLPPNEEKRVRVANTIAYIEDVREKSKKKEPPKESRTYPQALASVRNRRAYTLRALEEVADRYGQELEIGISDLKRFSHTDLLSVARAVGLSPDPFLSDTGIIDLIMDSLPDEDEE